MDINNINKSARSRTHERVLFVTAARAAEIEVLQTDAFVSDSNRRAVPASAFIELAALYMIHRIRFFICLSWLHQNRNYETKFKLRNSFSPEGICIYMYLCIY